MRKLLSSSLLLLLAACSSSKTGDDAGADPAVKLGLKPGTLNNLTSIETQLLLGSAEPTSNGETVAGTTVGVVCVAQPGDVKIPQPTFNVAPSTDVAVKGGTLTPHKAGSYKIACTLPNAAKTTDDTPALLMVRPGPAKAIVTSVTPSTFGGGEQAQVVCAGKDAHGNAVPEDSKWTVTVDPPATATVKDKTLTGGKAGKAVVKCNLADTPDASNPGAQIEVVVGKPAKTVAKLAPASIVAGEGSATVTCAVVDGGSNEIASDPSKFTIETSSDLSLSGNGLSGTKSGTFDVKCVMAGGPEAEAAKLEVKPGAPVSMELKAKPDLKVYQPDAFLTLSGLGKDKFGNDVPGMPVTQAAVEPADDVSVVVGKDGGVSYGLRNDGIVKFTASSVDFPALSGSLTIKVDSTGPNMLVGFPARAATLSPKETGGSAKVTVKGTCIDQLSATKSFKINGQDVTIGGDGGFEFVIDSQPGMNVILWEAADEWDNKSNGVQTYVYSTEWHPDDHAKPEAAAVKNGIGVWMDQKTIDAGPPHDHKKPKDLASVFEIVLGEIDIAKLLGNQGFPVNQGALGFNIDDVQIQSLKWGDKGINDGFPEVAINVIEGGMRFKAKIYNLDMVMRVNISITVFGFKTKGFQDVTVKAQWLDLESDLLLSLDANGQPKSEAKNTSVKINKLDIKLGGNSLPGALSGLTSTIANGVIGFLDTFLNGVFTGALEQVLKGQIQTLLGGQVGAALGALAINTDIPLSPFIGKGDPVKLKLASKLGLLDFHNATGDHGMLIGLNASVTAPKKVKHQVLGSYGRAACLEAGKKDVFNPSLKYLLEIGLADDFANALLHGVWNGGLLNLAVGADALGSVDVSQFGVSDVNIATDFLLPPMLNTCLDKTGDAKVQVGDLLVNAKLNFGDTPVDVWMYITLQATAKLDAVPDPANPGSKQIGLTLKTIDLIEMEVYKINAEAKGLKDVFVTLIKTVLVPQLTNLLGQGLGGFPLPEFDLSSFSPSIPPGTKIALEIQKVDTTGGYTYLRGKVK
jgi:hypothetical protein